MTHMDDQVAKHIKQVIRRAMRKAPEEQEYPPAPDTLNQIIRTLRRGPDHVIPGQGIADAVRYG
jgi:hypothetical protein